MARGAQRGCCQFITSSSFTETLTSSDLHPRKDDILGCATVKRCGVRELYWPSGSLSASSLRGGMKFKLRRGKLEGGRTKTESTSQTDPSPQTNGACYSCGITRPITDFKYSEDSQHTNLKKRWWKTKSAAPRIRYRCVLPSEACITWNNASVRERSSLYPAASVQPGNTTSRDSIKPKVRDPPTKALLYSLIYDGRDDDYAREMLRSFNGWPEWQEILQRCVLEAAAGGRLTTLQELERLGADFGPATKDCSGDTALHLAARTGQREVVKWLIKHYSVGLWARNTEGQTALDSAKLAGAVARGCAISLRLAMPGTTLGDGKEWWNDLGNGFTDRLGAYDRPLPSGGSDSRLMRMRP